MPGKDLRPIVAAVDLGGSRLRLSALRGGRSIAEWEVPSVPPARLAKALAAYWRRRGWGRIGHLLVGSKGVWTWPERRRLTRALGSLAELVTVISDVELGLWAALGRAGAPMGVYLVAGTGSIALGRDDRGRLARAGGLGPRTGDEGSGFWLGREFLKRVKGNAGAHRLGDNPRSVRRTAALAEKVIHLARRDARCAALVREAQALLADLALEVGRRLKHHGPLRFTWGGSLLSNTAFRRGVSARLRGYIPVAPPPSPTRAAARMANRIAQGAPSSVPPRLRTRK